MLQFNICKPGFNPAFMPSTKRIRFFNIDSTKVSYKVRQKYRNLDYIVMKIQEYSSRDIKLYIDCDSVTLIDFTSNHILFTLDIREDSSFIEFHLSNVQQLFRYDRYPESISTTSQYNHYKSLINQYYGQEKGNH